MNMILHNNPVAQIVQGNTLADPKFKDGDTLKTFHFVVANPPFSDKRLWQLRSLGATASTPTTTPSTASNTSAPRPPNRAITPTSSTSSAPSKSSGKGACILPHGVLFRGNAEAEIRRNLIRRGYIKGIVGLPANLFYGTGIPACIVVIDKEDAHARKGIFMIDAGAGYLKDGNKNRLRAMDIHKIVDVFNKCLEVPNRSVPPACAAPPKTNDTRCPSVVPVLSTVERSLLRR